MTNVKRTKPQKHICILASVPVTIWSFYRQLVADMVSDGTKVTVIASEGEELGWLSNECGCSTKAVEIKRRIDVLGDLKSFLKLSKFLFLEKPDMMHAHTPKGGLLGMLSAFFAGCKKRIYTVHGLPMDTATGLKRKLLWAVEWLSCKLATKVLAVSPSLKKRMIEEKLCNKDKITVLNHGSACGIDLSRFKPDSARGPEVRKKLGIPTSAFVIGFVGRIVNDKGVSHLVRAFEVLQKDFDDIWLMLVGDFETVRDSLDPRTAKKIDDNGNITCSNGFIKDIVPYYAAMDMLALPTKREGFGLVLIEAAAMKLPVVATRVTGCVDAVDEDVTGRLVEPESLTELTEALRDLLENSDERNRLGQNGFRRTHEKFDSIQLVKVHLKFYDHLLNEMR
ncbi:Putative teichuronic acid biosynthesis glycosyltransferase TuaC [Anaerohalosphaera lusitana]|uniref:Putative teichuronic acid biosynthesis glycosyltransferase TuaC n=1 Tax=Anaerohalosphaera lusitana TaxID=1936003 RepID=A0A1U9NQY8_9BACT|nr:glycosyltransferase family 4 protein [Anaerohalosphaera lusitana]AQT70333.1 Putative teichuronic acid biosynthesis glycosyltransferase TuaC [Anaerohalosphaera lusitana]